MGRQEREKTGNASTTTAHRARIGGLGGWDKIQLQETRQRDLHLHQHPNNEHAGLMAEWSPLCLATVTPGRLTLMSGSSRSSSRRSLLGDFWWVLSEWVFKDVEINTHGRDASMNGSHKCVLRRRLRCFKMASVYGMWSLSWWRLGKKNNSVWPRDNSTCTAGGFFVCEQNYLWSPFFFKTNLVKNRKSRITFAPRPRLPGFFFFFSNVTRVALYWKLKSVKVDLCFLMIHLFMTIDRFLYSSAQRTHYNLWIFF